MRWRHRPALALLVVTAACARPVTPPPVVTVPAPPPVARPTPAPQLLPFTATAYSIEGRTASGARAREGIVASDPDVLPLGSRIRVHDAGKYSGEYSVEDTGRAIDGHEIDIYVADDAEAKRFGKQRVRVEVLSYGGARRR